MKRLRSHFVCEHSPGGPCRDLETKKKRQRTQKADVRSFAIALCRTEDNS